VGSNSKEKGTHANAPLDKPPTGQEKMIMDSTLFDLLTVRETLVKFGGNISQTIEHLIAMQTEEQWATFDEQPDDARAAAQTESTTTTTSPLPTAQTSHTEESFSSSATLPSESELQQSSSERTDEDDEVHASSHEGKRNKPQTNRSVSGRNSKHGKKSGATALEIRYQELSSKQQLTNKERQELRKLEKAYGDSRDKNNKKRSEDEASAAPDLGTLTI